MVSEWCGTVSPTARNGRPAGQQLEPPSRLECLPPPTHPGLLGARPSKVEKASPGGRTVPTTAPFHGGILRPAAGHGLPSQCAHFCGLGAGGAP